MKWDMDGSFYDRSIDRYILEDFFIFRREGFSRFSNRSCITYLRGNPPISSFSFPGRDYGRKRMYRIGRDFA